MSCFPQTGCCHYIQGPGGFQGFRRWIPDFRHSAKNWKRFLVHNGKIFSELAFLKIIFILLVDIAYLLM